jgi:putative multiple sugar transport system substrate-binding protein
MSTRRTVAALFGATLVLGTLGACGSGEEGSGSDSGSSGDGTLIGITMPTKSLERWNNDGANLVERLKAMGYETTLDYADNKVEQQISQLENQINSGAKVLVVASIDGTALGPTLAKAAAADIKIVAYDRLLMETEDVDYYATFDNYLVGQLQGEYIRDTLDLDNAAGPFNLEPFAGSPDDNNASLFFGGAWDVLEPYVASGKLVVPSGKNPATKADWKAIGIQGWDTAKAQAEMDNRLNSFYGDKKVDVVLSPNDSLALGIEQSLETAGYKVGGDWPIVTGQDADKANAKNIVDGKQAMTVWKDTRKLAEQVSKMVDEIVKGSAVETNDDKSYDNKKKVVPSYLVQPQVVTKENIEQELVGSNFLKASDLGL